MWVEKSRVESSWLGMDAGLRLSARVNCRRVLSPVGCRVAGAGGCGGSLAEEEEVPKVNMVVKLLYLLKIGALQAYSMVEVTISDGVMARHTHKCMKESEHERTKRNKKRKRRRKKVNWFFFHPDDILCYILKRVPNTFLRYMVKHVCRRWFDIITNRILLNDAYFILRNDITVRLVDIREKGQGLQVKEQYLDIPPIVSIQFWCNEFLLISCLF